MFRLCNSNCIKTDCVNKIFHVLVVLALVLLPAELFAISVVPQTSVFYVNDAAGLLSEETEQYIVSINDKLRAASGAQVVVVTVPDMGGASLEEYATALFRTYGIGDAKKNNGVLMLLALKERQSRIEVGYGLEGVLTDGKTGGIQDKYMIPYYKEGKWGEGVVNGFNAIIDEIKAEYGISIESTSPVAGAPEKLSLKDVSFQRFWDELKLSLKDVSFQRFWDELKDFVPQLFCFELLKYFLYFLAYSLCFGGGVWIALNTEGKIFWMILSVVVLCLGLGIFFVVNDGGSFFKQWSIAWFALLGGILVATVGVCSSGMGGGHSGGRAGGGGRSGGGGSSRRF